VGTVTHSETIIFDVLAKHTKMGKRKREELATLIDEVLIEAGFMDLDEAVEVVEVRNARMPVEAVEAYGLLIEVDALGDAVTVSSPDGFEVAS
jgi:hypothetical protein